MMNSKERDEKGHFRSKGWRETRAAIAADNDLGPKISEIFKEIGIRGEKAGVVQLGNGNWRLGPQASHVLCGALCGLIYSLEHSHEQAEAIITRVGKLLGYGEKAKTPKSEAAQSGARASA